MRFIAANRLKFYGVVTVVLVPSKQINEHKRVSLTSRLRHARRCPLFKYGWTQNVPVK